MNMESRIAEIKKKYRDLLVCVLVSFFIVLPVLDAASTYLHERAHVEAMQRAGIDARIDMKWRNLLTFKFWENAPFGQATFLTPEDKVKFNELSEIQLLDLTTAGIRVDIRIVIVILILQVVVNLLPWTLLKDASPKLLWLSEKNSRFYLWFNIILFLWAGSILWSTIGNLTQVGSDIWVLAFS